MWGLGKRWGETRQGFSGVDCSASHELKDELVDGGTPLRQRVSSSDGVKVKL
jgi:hypothetical protein